MQAGKRYTFLQTVNWSKKYVLLFIVVDSIPVILYQVLGWDWLQIPWQPISLIGIAVAFYLGFKNSASYDRLWEARKIWGGIVNTSRAFTVMARDFVSNDETPTNLSQADLDGTRKQLVHRHVAWLRALVIELRKPKEWEHSGAQDNQMRRDLGAEPSEDHWPTLKAYLSDDDYTYAMSKGNRSSHLLSLQSKHLMQLRREGLIEHFRHLKLQTLVTELYALQGKSERIKNFPFPRQYAAVNHFFVVTFVSLLPFAMINIFTRMGDEAWVWLSIPFSVICSWVFWMMDMIGDYSENPFEGLSNDVPISTMARGIEIDIREMLDETDLPEQLQPVTDMHVLM